MSTAVSRRSKFIGSALCAALVAAGFRFASADAPEAPQLSTLVAVADLDAALQDYLAKLKPHMADEAAYTKGNLQLGQKANAVVALLQTIGNHDAKSASQPGAIDGMTAARDLARSKDFAGATKAYQALEAALAKTGGADAKPKWEKFASLGRMMNETTEVNNRLRRNLKRFAKTKADSAEAAAVLTAFAQATIYDTHEVKNPADLPKWYDMAVEMRTASAELSKSAKSGDEAGFKAALTRLDKSCTACHDVFHKE